MMANFRIMIALAAGAACAQDLVPVPGGSYEVTDQITSVKLRVSVSDFLLGAAEVTQKQYEAILSSNPSVYKGADRPVENVNWWDAIRYCNLRSAAENLPQCYDLSTGRRESGCTGYRLPTEAEWNRVAEGKPSEEEARTFHLGVSNTKIDRGVERGDGEGNRAGSHFEGEQVRPLRSSRECVGVVRRLL